MAQLPFHFRILLVALLVVTGASPAFAQVSRTTRSLYVGSVLNVSTGGRDLAGTSVAGTPAGVGRQGRNEPLLLDLTLYPDGFAYGRLSLPQRGLVISGTGTLVQGTDLRLIFNRIDDTNPAWRPRLAHDMATSGDPTTNSSEEADAQSAVVASFAGRRESDFGAEGRSISGSLSLTAEAGTVLTTEMQRFSIYSTWELSQGRIHAAITTPHVIEGGDALNEVLESSGRQRLERFVSEGRGYAASGVLGWAWELEEYVTVAGVAGSYVSLLNSIYTYTGGAHPNTFYDSYLYELRPSGVSEVTLEQLFRAGSNWLSRITPLILSDLERQEAAWVTQGQVTELTPADLSTFTLGPAGLTFHFAPYAMGPYVQGSFDVTVEYGQLLGLAPAGGPLELFASGAAVN